MGHQCVVGGVGNRQMISIGGFNEMNDDGRSWKRVDHWANGVGVLDLPSMTWTNAYNATAAAYDSPPVVQEWYNKAYVVIVTRAILLCLLTDSRNLESVVWSSDEVKSVFMAGSSAFT